jgi:tetratricopeptide (TPR) repeat protein
MTESHTLVEIDFMISSVESNLAANPGYAELCGKLGLLHALKGQFQEARAQFLQCLSLVPLDLEARVNLAFLHIQQRNWKEVATVVQECLRINPGDSLCCHILGLAFLVQGGNREAIEAFEKSAQLDSFYRFQYEKLGVLKDGEITLSEPSERSLIKNGEKLPVVNLHHFVGECYVEMGDMEKAIHEFRRATRIYPSNYKGHLRIGTLYDLQGDYGKAIGEFQKAARIYPDCGIAFAHMSYAYAGTGDLRKALEPLKKAVEIHPQRTDLRYQLGLLYEDMEMYPEAIDELTAAVNIDPKYLFARINLGVIYDKTGKTEEALEEYEAVAELVTQDKDLIDRIDQLRRGTPPPGHSNPLKSAE